MPAGLRGDKGVLELGPCAPTDRARELIHDRLTEELSLGELADMSRCFRRYLHVTPGVYRRALGACA